MLAEAHKASSVHVTFNTQEEAELLERECGFMSRIGMQFHWCGRARPLARLTTAFDARAMFWLNRSPCTIIRLSALQNV